MLRSLALAVSVGLVVGLGVAASTSARTSAPSAAAVSGRPGDAVIGADGAVVRAASVSAELPAADEVSVTTVDVVVSEQVDLLAVATLAPEQSGVQSPAETLVADAGHGGRVLTDVLETDGFQTLGVTWPDDEEAAALDLQVRTRDEAGQWSGWQPLDVADGGPDAGTPDAMNATRAGTDPLWVGEADAVQLSVAAEQTAPADLSLTLVDVPVESATVAAQAVGTGQAEVVSSGLLRTADDAPQIISREEWGARPQVCQPNVATRLVGAVVHHTAGSNAYSTVAQAMQQIRGDQAYHIDGRGWCDIGYNFVIDKWGNIYEGRDDSLTKPVVGVHAGGFNTGTLGVSMLGSYDAAPPAAVQHAVAKIIGWRLGYYGVDPAGSMSFYTSGGENSSVPPGTTVTLPRVFGHRDVAYTACPGNGGYATLPGIRAEASSYSFSERFRQARAVVQSLYQDLLGRSVDGTGLDAWSASLAGGGDQAGLVHALTDSEEYIRLRITEAYQDALGRAPDPGGMAYWYDRIRARTATVDDVERRFYDSDEYVTRGGGTAAGYVSLLYQTMFDRPASAEEAPFWTGYMQTRGRAATVDAIWFSLEAAVFRAGGYYEVFLDREPDAAGALNWGTVLLAHGEGAVRAGIAGSEEYRVLALATYS